MAATGIRLVYISLYINYQIIARNGGRGISFYRTQVYLGSDLWVQVSLTK